jgi:hypothetical protein
MKVFLPLPGHAPPPFTAPGPITPAQPIPAFGCRWLVATPGAAAPFTTPAWYLGEVYARPSNSESRLINVSARNHVGTGHRVLIGGFTITGTSPLTVLVRAIGPGLQKYGVTGRLQDPVVALYHGQTKLAENDDWDSQDSPAIARAGAFALESNSKDSVIVAELAPGSYTAIVSGADGGTGEALLEVYEVP